MNSRKMMKNRLGMGWILGLALLCGEVEAQEGARRTCRVLFLGAPEGAVEKAWLHDGRSGQEVELPQMNLSKDASQIVIAIENAYRDFDAVRYAGFSEDDADVLRDAVRRSTYNVRDRLSD